VVGDLIGEGSVQEQSVVGQTPNLAGLQAVAAPDAVVIAGQPRSSERLRWRDRLEERKVRRLPAGGKWIRTSGSAPCGLRLRDVVQDGGDRSSARRRHPSSLRLAGRGKSDRIVGGAFDEQPIMARIIRRATSAVSTTNRTSG
jgi:hypothetical protein